MIQAEEEIQLSRYLVALVLVSSLSAACASSASSPTPATTSRTTTGTPTVAPPSASPAEERVTIRLAASTQGGGTRRHSPRSVVRVG